MTIMHYHSLLAVAVTVACCATARPQEPMPVPTGQRQLFLDGHGIAELMHLKRTMHQPAKRGAVLKPDRPWESTLQTRCAPAWDKRAKCFKLWMITSTPMEGVAGATYAESVDGVKWTKPLLRQWEYERSLENNFVAVNPKLSWPANAMENVVYDPDENDPQRRYKGFLGAFGRQPIVSPDGMHWKRLAVAALPSSDESNLSYDRPSRTFIATLKRNGPFGRAHGIWVSKDFEKWTDTGVLLHADEEDQRLAKAKIAVRLADRRLRQPVFNVPASYNADFYNVGVFRYEGLYVALPAVFYTTSVTPDNDGFHEIQLAVSRDLRTWQRLGDRGAFIGPSEVGKETYDHTQLLPPSAPVVRDDELWFYYTGTKYRVLPKDADRDMGAICLAVLRRDGFISLDAGKEPGTLRTKPLVMKGRKLSVNVDASEGALEVSVIDGAGKTVAVSEPIAGNKLRARVQWRSGDLASHAGRPISLVFTLRSAQFYSFWCEE
jgi:hypothetical protein